MSRHRFDRILRHLVFSHQPEERPDDVSSEAYRWMLVDDFVDLFNSHRKEYVNPSSKICVDESMSKWNGLGGTWINIGLPNYITMDRKPEDGAEIQNAADGHSGIMLRLKIVKSAAANEENGADAEANG